MSQDTTFDGHYVPLMVEVSITHFHYVPDEADLLIWLPHGGILARTPLTEEMATQLYDEEYITEDLYTKILAICRKG